MGLRLLVVFLLGGVLAFAPAPPPRPKRKPDVKHLQGRWILVGFRLGPLQTTFEAPSYHLEIVIADGKYTYFHGKPTDPDGVLSLTSELVVDTNKDPWWFDLRQPGGAVTMMGLCELAGDSLKICNSPAKYGRPRNLEPRRSHDRSLLFKRVKP